MTCTHHTYDTCANGMHTKLPGEPIQLPPPSNVSQPPPSSSTFLALLFLSLLPPGCSWPSLPAIAPLAWCAHAWHVARMAWHAVYMTSIDCRALSHLQFLFSLLRFLLLISPSTHHRLIATSNANMQTVHHLCTKAEYDTRYTMPLKQCFQSYLPRFSSLPHPFFPQLHRCQPTINPLHHHAATTH